MNRNQFSCTLALLKFVISAQAQNTTPYWSLAGNSNATAASKLGTTNSTPLRLMTNNAERLRIDPFGKVGIGTASPTGKLTLFNNGSTPAGSWVTAASPLFVGYGETTGGNADFFLAMASNTRTTRPNILGRRARGTLAAPMAVVDNDFITSFQASGYDGSAFQNPANIDFFVDGAPSAGNVPVRISLTTGSNVSNRVERLKVGSTGNFTFNYNQLYLDRASGNIGIGTLNPSYKLDVGGPGSFVNSRTTGFGIKAKGPEIGVYGDALEINNDGNVAGGGTGVRGDGIIGVEAHGEIYGLTAFAGCDIGPCIGILGSGREVGIQGEANMDWSGTGITGNGWTGIIGTGKVAGIVGIGGNEGFVGDAFGARGSAAGDMGGGRYGIYGYAAGSYDFNAAGYFEGDVWAASYYTMSDRKLKTGIAPLKNSLQQLMKLKPSAYQFKTDEYSKMGLPKGRQIGLIADEVKQVFPELVTKGVHPAQYSKDEKTVESPEVKYEGVNYQGLIPVLIASVQELSRENDELEKKNKHFEEQIAKLRKMVLELKSGRTGAITYNAAYLEQNTPNPVNGTTTIRYHVPEAATSARLAINNTKGQLIRTISISNKGAGQANFNTSSLAAGAYNYTLYVDGRQADTRRLIISR